MLLARAHGWKSRGMGLALCVKCNKQCDVGIYVGKAPTCPQCRGPTALNRGTGYQRPASASGPPDRSRAPLEGGRDGRDGRNRELAVRRRSRSRSRSLERCRQLDDRRSDDRRPRSLQQPWTRRPPERRQDTHPDQRPRKLPRPADDLPHNAVPQLAARGSSGRDGAHQPHLRDTAAPDISSLSCSTALSGLDPRKISLCRRSPSRSLPLPIHRPPRQWHRWPLPRAALRLPGAQGGRKLREGAADGPSRAAARRARLSLPQSRRPRSCRVRRSPTRRMVASFFSSRHFTSNRIPQPRRRQHRLSR